MVEEVNDAEIIKNAMDEFEKVQRYMTLAKEENAKRTKENLYFFKSIVKCFRC